MADPEGARDMVCLFMMIGAAPGLSVCPPISYWEAELAVITWPQNVMLGGGVANIGARFCVWPATTAAEASGARDTTVHLWIIAGPPGRRVWEPTTNCDAEFVVMAELPMVSAGFGPAVCISSVLGPITTPDPEEGRDSTVPE